MRLSVCLAPLLRRFYEYIYGFYSRSPAIECAIDLRWTKALETSCWHSLFVRTTYFSRGLLYCLMKVVYPSNIRAFFGSIPEDFGNRGESTTTKLPMRNKQWQKHHKKKQTMGNRMTVFFFCYEVGTAVWPRKFYHFVS